MQFPIRHFLGEPKGYVIDVPGTDGELSMRGPSGNVLLDNARIELISLDMKQDDPAKAPVEMATLKVTRRTADGGRMVYNIVQPSERVITDFKSVLADALGENTK